MVAAAHPRQGRLGAIGDQSRITYSTVKSTTGAKSVSPPRLQCAIIEGIVKNKISSNSELEATT